LPIKIAEAFAPAAISSFFEICDQTRDCKPISDLRLVGSRGGGFGLQRGVLTKVKVSEAKTSSIHVCINGKAAPEAQTTKSVLEKVLSYYGGACDVFVDHKIEVPIGAGFGTSAGGAITAGLALKEALDLPMTYNQIAGIAHVADIQCKTGLGTVTPLTVGGSCMLVLEPGAPGIGVVDRIPLNPDYVIVIGIVGNTASKSVLSSPEKKLEINRWGRKTLKAVLSEASIENFLTCCWQFAQKTGFATEKTEHIVHLAKKAGAIGAAQNMIGEVVHALVVEKNASRVAEAFREVVPEQNIFVSKLDFQGARLVSGS
jgi:pantoate kinase